MSLRSLTDLLTSPANSPSPTPLDSSQLLHPPSSDYTCCIPHPCDTTTIATIFIMYARALTLVLFAASTLGTSLPGPD